MKTHYSWFEVENAKNDISQKYQYLLKQQDKTIYSYITENFELRQEIKNLKQNENNMIEDNIKTLLNAVSSLQRKVAFQEEIISKLLDFMNEKNNRFVTYTHDSNEGKYSEAGISREFVDIYQKEIENKTYRTLGEYCEEECGA